MGPQRPHSTRARKAHRSKKLRRKPARPKPTKFRTGADVLRDVERVRGTKAAKQLRVSPTQVLGETLDGVSSTEISGIRRRLKLAQSCVRIVGAALTDQNCNLDNDAADILAAHVTDVLHIQIMKIDRLLGHEVHEDDIEEGKG